MLLKSHPNAPLVLSKFPDDSGHRCIRPPMAVYAFPPVKLIPVVLCRVKVSGAHLPSHSPILALPDLVLGANSPPVSAPLGDSDQAGPAVPASGQDLASSARTLEVVDMAHTGPRALMNNLPVEVQETIASARAPASTFTFMHLADAFIQSDLQLHSGYTFLISMCVPWESNPQPFTLLTQCSTTEPHRNTGALLFQVGCL